MDCTVAPVPPPSPLCVDVPPTSGVEHPPPAPGAYSNGFLNRCVCCPTAFLTGTLHVLSNGFLNRTDTLDCPTTSSTEQVHCPTACSTGTLSNGFLKRYAVQRLPQEVRCSNGFLGMFPTPKIRGGFQDPLIRNIHPHPCPNLIKIVGNADSLLRWDIVDEVEHVDEKWKLQHEPGGEGTKTAMRAWS